MYDGIPFLYSFLICLYNTYYAAGDGHKMCIIMRLMGKVECVFIACTTQYSLVLH